MKWLCEKGGAASVIDGVPGVDIRSKDGWTPLSKNLVHDSSFFCC